MIAAVAGAVRAAPAIASAIGNLSHLGKGGPDLFRDNVWSKVPLNLIRVTGGHGKWRDPLTGEQMGDRGTDTRKIAVVAGAIGAWVDSQNRMWDAATGENLVPETSWQKWVSVFGPIDFPTAYSRSPSRFAVYQPGSSATDPTIGQPPSPKPQSTTEQVKAYVQSQVDTVVDSAKQAGNNIAGVASGAAAGAAAGARTTITTQTAAQNKNLLLYVGIGAVVVLIAAVVLLKKRS